MKEGLNGIPRRRTELTSPLVPIIDLSPESKAYKLREIAPIPRSDLRFRGNGIDLRSEAKKGHPFEYEDACFNTITSVSQGRKPSILVGPHLVDRIIGHGFRGSALPDGLRMEIMQREDMRDPQVWVLRDLYEFKSGAVSRPVKKLAGFENLLEGMREDDTYLPQLFKAALPWAQTVLPDRIIVPPNHDISVTFASNNLKHGVIFKQEETTLKVHHLFVVHPLRELRKPAPTPQLPLTDRQI